MYMCNISTIVNDCKIKQNGIVNLATEGKQILKMSYKRLKCSVDMNYDLCQQITYDRLLQCLKWFKVADVGRNLLVQFSCSYTAYDKYTLCTCLLKSSCYN